MESPEQANHDNQLRAENLLYHMFANGLADHLKHREHDEHNLQQHSRAIAVNIFGKKWNAENLGNALKHVALNGRNLSHKRISEKIANFQDLHKNIELLNFRATETEVSLEKNIGRVRAEADIELEFYSDGEKHLHQFIEFFFEFDGNYWHLSGLNTPGLEL